MTFRKIESLNKGIAGNPIHSFINSDNRKRLAPFSLFDDFNGNVPHNIDGGWHPHSGIATFTFMLKGDLTHHDTNGGAGLIEQGGAQLLSTGKGLWHDGAFQVDETGGLARDLQMWLQLPSEMEMGTDYYHKIVSPNEIPQIGNTTVLLGKYKGVKSAFDTLLPTTYLRVNMEAGETWLMEDIEVLNRGFVFNFEGGSILVEQTEIEKGVLGLFSDSSEPILIQAGEEKVSFVIALSPASYEPIMAQGGSIHTSDNNMKESKKLIVELGKKLKKITV